MASNGPRVLLYLKNSSSLATADFTECIVQHFQDKAAKGNLSTQISAELNGNRLILSKPAGNTAGIKLKHPEFCPIYHLASNNAKSLPVKSCGVHVGAAVILQTSDGKVLLTRRANHLHTFPGIWVPPGGHVEENETFIDAGLRELYEETGVKISSSDIEGGQLRVLALWESVYPPKLSLGQPVRHHIVAYLYGVMTPGHDSAWLRSDIKMDPEEVGACALFDKEHIEAIVSVKEGGTPRSDLDLDRLKGLSISGLLINENKEQVESVLPFAPLLQPAGDSVDQMGRVSTGTKFALEELLAINGLGLK
ncbi:hypothetical protein ACJMK2_043747 [Sinanodonta woodiana]|uniref:m7GpppN-mRNA hydrolase NUDT17 n=1 Tax=Sinanodonta woodiana TaxID=1069815 RepID=A0ABD3VXV1_SINWO